MPPIAVAVFGLYLAVICWMMRGSPRDERIQVCVLILIALFPERFLHWIDPTTTSTGTGTAATWHRTQQVSAIVKDFFSNSRSLCEFMAVCFLCILCLHNGGAIERFIVWKVECDEEDDDDFLCLDDDDLQERIERQRDHRRTVLMEFFENSGLVQVTRQSDIQKTTNAVLCRPNCTSNEGTRITPKDRSMESKFDTFATSCDCRICLESFQVHDRLIWSDNPECTHAFHVTCLTEYFARLGHKVTPSCPCCRQPFCRDLDDCGALVNHGIECR
ncbi:ring-like zinc finger domain containing protein [Nitzschia inconspicua]|uniref:Ring-like zinc finger domain containing protein n=1 Tax=Nitzschia inconspicua TaxID=303405 RepID=A0A9K3KUZ6_9STRA|nr:ring-like zinc finger domain containing protein [Nitzschia inconspicua]